MVLDASWRYLIEEFLRKMHVGMAACPTIKPFFMRMLNKADNMIVDKALELQSLPRQSVARNSFSFLAQQERLLAFSRRVKKINQQGKSY